MHLSTSKLALIVLAVVLVAELALIGALAGFGTTVPDQAWSLVYATVGVLAGAAGSQQLNGYSARREARWLAMKSQTPEK
jgi:hypothetical protein